MLTLDSPWVDRFHDVTREDLSHQLAYKPETLVGLHVLDVELATKQLNAALEELFIPTSQVVDIAHTLLEKAKASSAQIFSSVQNYMTNIYAIEVSLPEFISPTCLTGPAGVGKTSFLNRLQSLFPPRMEIDVDESHRNFPLISYWHLPINERVSLSDMLRPILSEHYGMIQPPKSHSDLKRLCRRKVCQSGVSMLFVDELQFLTRSQSANAHVTSVLHYLSSLGAPVVYLANYSMCERIKKRPQEDQERFLVDPIILLPELPDSEDWIRTLDAVREVAPDVFDFDPVGDASELYSYTAGLKRLVRLLLVQAYKIARSNGSAVRMREIRSAYTSTKFSVNRATVEELHKLYLNPSTKRKDLVCPFDLPETEFIQRQAVSKLQTMSSVQKAMLKSNLTKEERVRFESIEKAAEDRAKSDSKTRGPSRGASKSLDNLLRAEELFKKGKKLSS